MLVNWEVKHLKKDNMNMLSSDKVVGDKPYWFFKYWPEKDLIVDVCGINPTSFITSIEKKLNFYIIPTLKNLFKINKYDIILCHDSQSGLLLAFLRKIGFFKKTPQILIDVGLPGFEDRFLKVLPKSLKLNIISYIVSSFDYIMCHSSKQKEYYNKKLNIPYNKINFIPYSDNVDFFKPSTIYEKDYIITAGTDGRDYKTLFEAYDKYNIKIPLKVVTYKKIGLIPKNNKIKLINKVPINQFKKLVLSSKFLVLPLQDIKRSCGQVTLVQTMAMGKPVIISKTISSVDYVTNNKTGIFVKPYDVDDIYKKIMFLYKNKRLRIKIGHNARRSASDKFNVKKMSKAIHNITQKVLKSYNKLN